MQHIKFAARDDLHGGVPFVNHVPVDERVVIGVNHADLPLTVGAWHTLGVLWGAPRTVLPVFRPQVLATLQSFQLDSGNARHVVIQLVLDLADRWVPIRLVKV